MYDYLKDHALKNVWCTPDQDNQLIIQPKKITPPGGVYRNYKVMQKQVVMPDQSAYWHIYQIGQLHPLILGLLPKTNTWVSFAQASNANKMICDVYTTNGVMLPRFDTFYMWTNDRNLIIAVKRQTRFPMDLDADAVYMRVYTNAFFDSNRADQTTDMTYTQGAVAVDSAALLALQNAYNVYAAKPGLTMAFVNGYKVTAIDMIQMQVGDVGEFVYDSSVTKIVSFVVDDLRTFNSIKDSKYKYLLHYVGSDNGTIDYQDDIDVYILDPYISGRHRGLLFHKNAEDALRQLTHRDYSVPTAYVAGYKAKLEAIPANGSRVINAMQMVVRLHIRKSGYSRPLINEANRIADLYKLNDTDIVRSMLGLDAVVANWRAETLENSDYVKIMGSKGFEVTNNLVQNAYGYNSISKIIGDTPKPTYSFSGRKAIDVPYGLQSASTAYEYDSTGKLLGWYYHVNGSRYLSQNSTAAYVEMVSGYGKKFLTDKRGPNHLVIDPLQSYRVYRNTSSSTGVAADWHDVTGTDQYAAIDGFMERSDNSNTGNFIVRDEKSFLAYDLSLMMTNGELRFGLEQEIMVGSTLTSIAMEVPKGQLDLFLNGRSLINGLDYHIHFPEVAIVNKEYLVNQGTTAQKVHVRMTGFAPQDLSVVKPTDVGFIEHGVLSNNNKFDLRDDKVLRIVVDGQLKLKSELVFSEFHSGVSVLDSQNGKPYAIEEIVVPLKWLSTQPTFTLKAAAKAVDVVISNYMTVKIPQPPRDAPSAISQRYKLFSPFISRIIFAFLNQTFDETPIKGPYNDAKVELLITPYKHLLRADPTQQALEMNNNYVVIHPHNLTTVVDLDLYAYRFVERVIKLYTNNLVPLSPFVRIKPI